MLARACAVGIVPCQRCNRAALRPSLRRIICSGLCARSAQCIARSRVSGGCLTRCRRPTPLCRTRSFNSPPCFDSRSSSSCAWCTLRAPCMKEDCVQAHNRKATHASSTRWRLTKRSTLTQPASPLKKRRHARCNPAVRRNSAADVLRG